MGEINEYQEVFYTRRVGRAGKLTRDLIVEMIEQNNLEKAKKLTRRMHNEFQSMHDGICTGFRQP